MTTFGRAQSVSPDAQRLFRALIDSVLATGAPPGVEALVRASGLSPARVDQQLDELAQADWLARAANGDLTAVYPFALDPTGIDITIGNTRRTVMCAIDALGVAPMLGREAVTHAACVVCDTPISVRTDPDGIASRRPRSTVVIRRNVAGPAHANRCAATRFACSPAHADEWIARNGGPDDVMQSVETAFIEASEIFGHVYRN